jgi:hypothetical protein
LSMFYRCSTATVVTFSPELSLSRLIAFRPVPSFGGRPGTRAWGLLNIRGHLHNRLKICGKRYSCNGGRPSPGGFFDGTSSIDPLLPHCENNVVAKAAERF